MADLTITDANVIPVVNYNPGSGVAGEDLASAGLPVYKDSSDSNELKKCDADLSSAAASCVGITLHAAKSGQPVKYINGGSLGFGAILTVGETYVVSPTAGKIMPIGDLTSGDYVTYLGTASTTSNLVLDINATGIATP